MYKLNVINDKGENEILNVFDILDDTPFGKEYILFKRENDNTLYASELILISDKYRLQNVSTEEELAYINEILEEEN